MKALWAWLASMMSEADGVPSASRFVMVFGAGVAAGVLIALVWLVRDQPSGLLSVLDDNLKYFLGATVGGYGFNKLSGRGGSSGDAA